MEGDEMTPGNGFSTDVGDGDWAEYKRLVIHELREMRSEVKELRNELAEVRSSVTSIRLRMAAWGGAAGAAGWVVAKVVELVVSRT